MVTLKVRHLRKRDYRGKLVGWYFVPGKAMQAAGYRNEALGTDWIKAAERTEALNAEWDLIRVGEKTEPDPAAPGTMKWLIREYQASTWYTGLAERTRGEGDRHIAAIEDSPLAKAFVGRIGRAAVRRFYEKVAAARGGNVAAERLKWLRRILSYAVELELIPTNPASKMEIRAAALRRVTWTPEEVEAFKATAVEKGRRSWALAIQIGYDTAADLSDILRLTWTDFDGEGVTFRRSKTSANPNVEDLWIPLLPETIRMLDQTKRVAVQIITGDHQRKPIAHRSFFGKIYREIRADAKMRNELRFRDLRRSQWWQPPPRVGPRS